MANPEIAEGQASVSEKTEIMEVSPNISDVVFSTDEQRAAKPLVDHGEVLVEVSQEDPINRHFTSDQIQQMKKGPLQSAKTWLGALLERNQLKLSKKAT